MPKYVSDVDRWLSHENREVKAGEEFETTFPAGPGGKAMELGDSLHLIEPEKSKNTEPTVSDLKAELDALNIEYRGNAKKAELVKLLAEASKSSTDDSTVDEPTDESDEGENTSSDDLV